MREIRTCFGKRLAFARHLHDADDLVPQNNRNAHYFLDRVPAQILGDGNAFKDGCVRHNCEVIDDLWALFAYSADSERICARERNLTDGAQIIGRKEPKRPLVWRERQDGDLVRVHAEVFADQFDSAAQANDLAVAISAREFPHPLLQIADVRAGHCVKSIQTQKTVN